MGKAARMERVGGHPAIDFVNTLGGLPSRADDEYLFGYDHLVIWVEGTGLLTAKSAQTLRLAATHNPDEAADVFAQALHLRGALDTVLRAHLHSQAAHPRDLQALRDAHVNALAHAELQPDAGRYAWTWPATDEALEAPLWVLAHQAVELLRSAPLPRLERCGHCRWLFLDNSKNRSRRWCSMNACGSIMKMRRYRATHRS